MTIHEALKASTRKMPMAEGFSKNNKPIVAALRYVGIRIVVGTTDSTVVRKPTKFELASTGWVPVPQTREWQ